MSCKYFSPKRPGETVTLTFDFSNVLGTTETITSSTWTAEVREGEDVSPTISMVVGSPTISGDLVSHLIGSGIDETTYGIVCEINTNTSQVVQGVGLLKVDANCGD